MHKNDRNRSLPLAELLAHLPPGLDYVSVQQELPEADLQLLRAHGIRHGIRHFGEHLHDFSDTAALCDLMDIVLSVDTSVAHLAAAMGKPTWILLPYTPDWRWLLERSDSPWYPTARLYRQAEPGQWQRVLERVAEDLLGLCVQPGQPASPTFPAIPLQTPQVEAIFQQGLQQHRQGQLALAKAAYEEVLRHQPQHFDALQLLGALAGQSDNPALAVELIGRAIAIQPGFAKAHTNLAIALLELHRAEEALSSCDRAIALKPDFADAHTNRGLALLKLGRVEEALACHEQAIVLKPGYADAHSNRGAALYELKRLDDALASYDQALAINPQHAKAHTNKAFALLAGGQFRQGWEQYAWRLKVQKQARTFQQPVWSGAENLHGKTILLHGEQGLGDSIQFCRYAKLVQQLGARVLLEVPPPISALLRGLEGVDLLLQPGEPLPPLDYHCPLLSLPLAFGTELHSIPNPGPYLHSRADKRSQWSQRLGEKKNLRVGLVWCGNPAHTNDHRRSLPLAELLPHLPSGVDYVSLQKEVAATDLQLLHGSSIQHFGERLQDFSDTAALCDLLDIVLAVDTAVAHLAAAMGKATWIVLPFAPDWRWLLDRSDSPWYATATLYRQTEPRAWQPVLERVAHDLQQAKHSAKHSASTFQQGWEWHRHGQLALAKTAYEQVLQSQPAHVEALHLLGVLALQSNQHTQALEWMERALATNPAYAQAHFHRGMVLLAMGQLQASLASFDQTLALQSGYDEAHFYRGVVLHRLSRVEQAIAAYDQAIAHKPDHARAFNNRGLALQKLLRLEEALASYDQAIAIAPDFAEAHSRRGVTLVKCNQLEPALRSFDRAIALDPNYHETWFNKAMALLMGGEFGQGWELYEWRWKGERAGYAPGPFEQALWLGAENLSGKTILLLAEQGLGDCIQFCRYARLVKQRGARVLLQAPTPLLDLL
ncbi:MAG: tetratricopeptide repeat protein, partial [Rhodoferax sp.]|nr:tetratricopeptide repeat protein [Rhodoferax sp.]